MRRAVSSASARRIRPRAPLAAARGHEPGHFAGGDDAFGEMLRQTLRARSMAASIRPKSPVMLQDQRDARQILRQSLNAMCRHVQRLAPPSCRRPCARPVSGP